MSEHDNGPIANAPRPTPSEELLNQTKGPDERAGLDELTPTTEDQAERHAFDPGPISGNQHDLEHVEPRTDDATMFHPTNPTADSNDPADQDPTNSA